MAKTWLVTGASRGLGQSLSRAIAARGEKVVGTFRDEEAQRAFEDAFPGVGFGVRLDVTDAGQVKACVETALAKLGHIDVLVNNAGYGQFGAFEDLSEQQIWRLVETNFFGVLNMTRAVLPHFRERRSGRIVNISSVAGFSVFTPGASVYAASKFAVGGFSEALALEVGPLGIGITLVEPGAFRTDFGGSSIDLSETDSADYQPMFGPIRTFLKEHYRGTEPGDPDKAARAIIEALDAAEPPARLVLGNDALQIVRSKLKSVGDQVKAWEAVSASTDYSATS